MTAADVMDRSAALLNDVSKNIFSYTVQIPFLNTALDELQETLELNNVPMTNELSAVIPITTVMTDIGGTTGPALPTDLIEIQGIYERQTGTSNDFSLLTKVEFLPLFTQLTANLVYWTWQKQIVQFLGATTNRDVKLNYIGAVLATIATSATPITLFNSKSFLAYRTAALCAVFLGENQTRATELDGFALLAMDRLLGINAKGRQAIATRHRPFMAGYRSRNSW